MTDHTACCPPRPLATIPRDIRTIAESVWLFAVPATRLTLEQARLVRDERDEMARAVDLLEDAQ